MPRLIDADAIKYTMLYKENWLKGTGVEKQGVWKEDIDAMPTVDAVPVIRCKDCKHHTGKWCTKYSTKQFDINDICKADDDFCKCGERRKR